MKRNLLLFALILTAITAVAQGSSWQTATEIGQNGTVTGSLNEQTPEHWYKFQVPENGTVDVTVMAHGALSLHYTTLYVVDQNGNTHSRGSVWGGDEENPGKFTVTTCAPGTYYLNVHRNGGEGGYTLNYVFTPTSSAYPDDNEPNNTWQEATSLTSGVDVTGHFGYYYWDDMDETDWYKLEVPENGTVDVTVIAHGALSLHYTTLYVVDQNGETHSRGSVWGGDEENPGKFTVTTCAPGTYYLNIHRNSAEGGYTLNYVFTPTSSAYPDNNEPDNTWQEARWLKRNSSTTGHFGYYFWDDMDETDWYKINVPENGTVEITAVAHGALNLHYTNLYVVDQNGETHSRGSVWGGDEENPGKFFVKNCAPGTYYVFVHRNGGEGGYTLSYNFYPMSAFYADNAEPNNSWQEAHLLRRGNTLTGHLGYTYWDNLDEEDWYKLEVPRDGTIRIGIAGHGPFEDNEAYSGLGLYYTVVYALDQNGELHERGSVWAGNDENPGLITVPNAAIGTYYLKVRRNGGEGAYTVRYQFVQPVYAADAEPNNSWQSALTLDAGTTVSGHLGYFYWDDIDTEDWYRLVMPDNGNLTVTLQTPEEGLGLHYSTVYSVDSNGELHEHASIWSTDGQNPTHLTAADLPSGTYYVHIRHNGGQGYYLLSYSTTIGNVDPQDVLADEPQGQSPVMATDDGTTFEVDDEKGEVYIKSGGTTDDDGVYICLFPAPSTTPRLIHIIIPVDGVFKDIDNFDKHDIYIEEKTPPTIEEGALDGKNPEDGIVHVPEGTKTDYENDSQWGKFGTIEDDLPNPGLEVTNPTNIFIVWLDGGGTVSYQLSEKPEVRQNAAELTVSSATRTTVIYDWKEVLRFTLGNDELTTLDISTPQADSQKPLVSRDAERLLFQGCKAGQIVTIYDATGKAVAIHHIDADGQLQLSISQLPSGLNIVKSESVTIKIMKK